MANEFRVKNGLIVDEVSGGAGVITIADGVISSAQTMEILSTANADQSILMRENGGTDGTIKIHSDQGSGADSIFLLSDAGGVTVTSTAGVLDLDAGTNVTIDAADNITLTAADDVGLVTSSADGEIVLQSAHTAGRAIFLDGNAAAGSIVDIDSGILDMDSTGATNIDSGTTMALTATTTMTLTSSGAMSLVTDDHDDITIQPHSGQYLDVDGLLKTSPPVAASDDVTFTTSGGSSGSRTTLTAASGTPFSDFPASGQVKIEGMTTGEQPYSYTRTSDTVIVSTAGTFDDATSVTRQITLVPPAQTLLGQAAPIGLTGQFGHDGGQVTLDGGKWGNAGSSWAIGVMYGSIVMQDSISAKKLKSADNNSSFLYKSGGGSYGDHIPIFHIGGADNQAMTSGEDYFTAYGTSISGGSSSTPNETVYYNLKVASDTLSLIKNKQKVAGAEADTDSRLGAVIVNETANVKGMNGIVFNVDDTNFSRFLGTGSGSIFNTDYNFAVGHVYQGTAGTTQGFGMGYSNRSFNVGTNLNDSAFHTGSSTYGAQGSALATQNTFFQANISGLTAVGPATAPVANVTLRVGPNGETDVGGVLQIDRGTAAPTDQTDTIWNNGGSLYFNGTEVGSGGTASALAADDLSAGDGAVLITTTSGNITIDASANNTDIIFKGTDATADITMLTLDGSEAGAATFNSSVTAGSAGFIVGSTVITDDSIVMTPSTSDTATIAASTNGALAITTVDNAAAAANITITADGTFDVASAGAATIDSEGDIVLDANGADVILKDDGTQYGSLSNSSGNLVIKSGTTTALTMSGANVTVAGNLTVSGTTTAVNSTTMTVEDALIELGLVDGSAPGSETNIDFGMIINHHDGTSARKSAFFYDDTLDHWALSDIVTESGQVLTPAANATGLRWYYDANNHFTIVVDDNGATTLTTVDADGAAGNLGITADGTFTAAGTTVTLDSSGDIELNADDADVVFKDGSTGYGTITNSSGDMAIKAASGKGIELRSNTDLVFLIEDDAPSTAGTSSIFQFTTEATVGTDLDNVDAEFEPVVVQYTSGSTNLGRTEFGKVTASSDSAGDVFTYDGSAFAVAEVILHLTDGATQQANKMLICADTTSTDQLAFSNYSVVYSDGSTELGTFSASIASDGVVTVEVDADDDDVITYAVTFLA